MTLGPLVLRTGVCKEVNAAYLTDPGSSGLVYMAGDTVLCKSLEPSLISLCVSRKKEYKFLVFTETCANIE